MMRAPACKNEGTRLDEYVRCVLLTGIWGLTKGDGRSHKGPSHRSAAGKHNALSTKKSLPRSAIECKLVAESFVKGKLKLNLIRVKNMRSVIRSAIAGMALVTFLMSFVQAAHSATMTISFYKDDGDVVFDFFGSVDTSDLRLVFSRASFPGNEVAPGVRFQTEFFQDPYVSSLPEPYDIYRGKIDLPFFGRGPYVSYLRPSESISKGDSFGVTFGAFLLPSGYVSGSPISGSARIFNISFSEMGIIGGSRSLTRGNNTIKLEVVPIPAAMALLMTCIGVLGLLRKKSLRLLRIH